MKILIVDDEIVSRTKLTMIMENFGDCDAVDNGKDAVALFRAAHYNKDPFDLIMLDINLPEMDGIEVLSEIREVEQNLKVKKDDEAKILMATSYRDKDRIIASVQSGCNDYIGKPFDIDIIRKKLDRFGIRELGVQEEPDEGDYASSLAADRFIDSISSVFDRRKINLPTLPGIQAKFREMTLKGAVSRQLANLLKKDVAISAELIRLSNSAYYRGFMVIKSLEQAISRLGITATKQLVDELTSREYFSMKTEKYRYLIEKLWKHSIACAYASEITANLIKLQLAADPFFLGLLHDIGKLALLQIIADMERKGKLNGDISDRKLIDTIKEHHCQFGARLLEKWKYSESYINSALYHDDLIQDEDSRDENEENITKELLIVNFANILAKSIGYGLNAENGPDLDLENMASTHLLKLNKNQIDKTQKAVIEEMKTVEELI
ncbi:MAG: HDOD domain-containing protein [Desulfobacterales bacterium]|nr:MAG: HDOD domain-containing protein [Desulfobacterales bacterium]